MLHEQTKEKSSELNNIIVILLSQWPSRRHATHSRTRSGPFPAYLFLFSTFNSRNLF